MSSKPLQFNVESTTQHSQTIRCPIQDSATVVLVFPAAMSARSVRLTLDFDALLPEAQNGLQGQSDTVAISAETSNAEASDRKDLEQVDSSSLPDSPLVSAVQRRSAAASASRVSEGSKLPTNVKMDGVHVGDGHNATVERGELGTPSEDIPKHLRRPKKELIRRAHLLIPFPRHAPITPTKHTSIRTVTPVRLKQREKVIKSRNTREPLPTYALSNSLPVRRQLFAGPSTSVVPATIQVATIDDKSERDTDVFSISEVPSDL